MVYQVEKDAKDFGFWGGAERFMEECEKRGVAVEVCDYLDGMFDGETDGTVTETDINDFVWFEADTICEELWGITEEEFWEGGKDAQETAE